MATNERFYTVPEIAVIASVSRRTVVHWIQSGKLEAYRNVKGGPWRVSESAWNKFKNEGQEEIFFQQYKAALEIFP